MNIYAKSICKERVKMLKQCFDNVREKHPLVHNITNYVTVNDVANIKSAKKRVKVIEKKTLRNNMIKSAYKTAVKKFEQAIEAGNMEEAKTLFSEATKKIDQACTKGVIVKNTAARKKSSLSKKLNAAMA